MAAASPASSVPAGSRAVREWQEDPAEEAGRLMRDVPVNHSPAFAPVIRPTLETGTAAPAVAALAWPAR